MESVQANRNQSRAAFGLFEADLKAGELWKAGYRVRLQALPFKVLRILLENAGEIVTREELQRAVWGPDVIVDFEHALSNAVKKLREALGDSADNPRFIETLSRRGFRFIAPVAFPAASSQSLSDNIEAVAPAPLPEARQNLHIPGVQSDTPALIQGSSRHRYLDRAAFLLLGCMTAGGVLLFWNAHRLQPVLPRIFQITQDGTIYSPKVLLLGTLSAVAADGVHLFTPSNENGRVVLAQISISTGASQSLPLPSQIGVPEVEDISPDGTQLLLRSNLGAASQQPLWIVPIDGGSAFRVSDVMTQSATWMPDARNILYASGNQLSVVSLENGRSTAFATVPGRAFWPRWSPDGKLLRFTMIDAVNHTSSLWQISGSQGTAHQIMKTWSVAARECCGSWTADGKNFVFEATTDGTTDLWKIDGSSDSDPVRITSGPLNFKAPVPSRTGEEIFFVGQDIHSRLEQFDAAQKQYVPVQGFLSVANHVNYSRDGRWVAWVDPNGHLWRARSDGTERVLLTPASMQVFMVVWSPDNTQLAFMSRSPKEPWQIYTVRAEGGTPRRLTQENRNLGDPSFSADGKSIIFGVIPELMGQSNGSNSLRTMELATHRVSTVPHTEGMYSPKWSPDGRYLAALTLDQKKLMLYDTKTDTWKTLSDIVADHPFWSKDSKSLYFHASFVDRKPIYRVNVPDGQIAEVADLDNFHAGSMTLADFSGLTPDDVPLMHAEVSSGNLYTLDLKQQR
ncbi:MAG TPA: winged helix-turn-helix domain-containing protein [Acidobacteriaceae bacterium]|nr:winged helix-turn-helix domain-containing protein [Acidobacteriaceae bacterium]